MTPFSSFTGTMIVINSGTFDTCMLYAAERQTAVTAYLESKLLLLFAFELQDSLLPTSTGIMTAVQRQTAVTAHLESKQLLKFGFVGQIYQMSYLIALST